MESGFESGPGYESYSRERRERNFRDFEEGSETERLRGLGEILSDIGMETEDPLTREIAYKFAEKLHFKQQIEAIQQGADDVDSYQKVKKLGLFLVYHHRMEQTIHSAENDFALEEGDEVLDLHLPPVDKDQRKELLQNATKSFQMIAEYIQQHKLQPKYITGITYEALARLAPRFGFTVKKIELPENLSEPVQRVYEQTERGRNGLPVGDIEFIYQDTIKFLERFGSKPEIPTS